MIIDTHNHVYLNAFDADRKQVIERMLAEGVERCYMPGIDRSVWEAMQKTHDEFSYCIPMPGLHPCSVNENFEKELEFVSELLSNSKWPAIGEIGLDYYWDKTFAEQQMAAFNLQMEWALQYKLPIVIHTRNAMQETIDAVKPFAQCGLKGIFHCFSGNAHQAGEITAMDFLLGIGGVVTYKNSGLAEAIKSISLQHIVLETDAPYLTPVPFRGKRNEPSYLKYVVSKLSEVFAVNEEEIKISTTRNARNLFMY